MSFDSNVPIYLQLIAILEGEIVAGRYGPGDKLPSRRELATRYQVNPNTVQRAFKDLEERGIIETQVNVGSQVTENQEKLRKLAEDLLKTATDEYFTRIQHLNLNKDFLKHYLSQYIDVYQGGD